MRKRIKILIRFDDICPTMNFKQFERAIGLMDKYHIKPLLGVIPDCNDKELMLSPYRDDFWAWLKRLQDNGYTIAMHGLNHIFTSKTRGIINSRHISEFAGHSLDEQIYKINRGKAILLSHGIETDVFFAPAHSYDENTLIALAHNGFHYVSDSKSEKPYMLHNVKCLPDRDAGCPKISILHSNYTAVFHAHEWTIPEKSFGFSDLEDLIKKYHDYIVTFEEYKNIPCGNVYVQLLIEKINVLYDIYVWPVVIRIKRKVKKIIKHN